MRKRDIMNYVVAEGGNKVQRDIAEKVVDFMIGQLLPRYRTLDITVQFKNLTADNAIGYCMMEENNREFTIEVDRKLGIKELGLNWPALLCDLVDAPIEPLQTHYMRVGKARGQLANSFSRGWEPKKQWLLLEVMAVNRRYQRVRNDRILKQLALHKTAEGMQCDPTLSERAKGLRYTAMVALAEKANFRHALWQMGEAIAKTFAEVQRLVPEITYDQRLDRLSWDELTEKWRRP